MINRFATSNIFRSVLLASIAALPIGSAVTPSQAAGGDIPAHPKDLVYEEREFDPPEASDYRRVIAGGTPIYIAEDHDFPLIDLTIRVRTGSYLEPADKIGLASMTGSQMRSGGTTSMNAEDFDEEVAFLAANISARIGDTQGTVSAGCLSKDIDRVLELMFDMLRNPGFQADRLELAKTQSLQRMKRRNDRTSSIEGREWGRLMRGVDHFSTKQSTQASIESITREDMIEFHRRYFHPKGFLISVAGDFDTAELIAKLEKHLAGWKSPEQTVMDVPEPHFTPAPGLYVVDKPDVNQGRISLGHLGGLRTNPDRFAIFIMNDILGGGGFTSRIMSRVRSDEGLAYSAGSRFGMGIYYEGVFRAAFQSKTRSCAQATAIVLEEIERIRTELVSEEEVQTAVQSTVETFPTIFANARQIVSTFAADEYTGRDPNYWKEYRAGVEAVTREAVRAAAKKYLAPDKLVILAVGNAEELLKGNPDLPQYALEKLGDAVRIPLPDPMTLEYPETQ